VNADWPTLSVTWPRATVTALRATLSGTATARQVRASLLCVQLCFGRFTVVTNNNQVIVYAFTTFKLV